MKLYAFELGRKKELCFAELIAIFGKDKLFERNLDTAIFKLEKVDGQKLQDSLGGTIKIIELFNETKDKLEIPKLLEDHLLEAFKDHSGKIPFALSLLSFYNTREINIKHLLNYSKKILKSLGLNSRFVNKNFQNSKPSTIYKAKVLQKGIDFNIIKGLDRLYIGETIAIQNIDNYSKRDYDKPCRDAKVGMLPPKLAQIMINLAGPSTKTIYDPFCGTGTVLTEGMLMKKDVVGSDISDRMVEFSEKNCEWTRREFFAKKEFRTFEKDSRFITKNDIPEKIDAVVTEGYLGNPVSKLPSQNEQETTFRELANLHLNWLSAVGKISNCKVVMCTAAFKDTHKIIHLPRFEEIAKTAGYKVLESFTYDRPDQIVARDIRILEKI